MSITVIDFETYFDERYSLKMLSIPEYVHDARFHVHGVAICWPDGVAEFRTDVPNALQALQARFGEHLERTCAVCHHSQFDLYILNHKFGIRPASFTDTMLLANHVHGRRDGGVGRGASLAALAELYALKPKGCVDFMRGVLHPDVSQLADLSAYARRDAEITHELAIRLLPKITRPETELNILMHTVRLFTERVVHVDVPGIELLKQEIVGITQAQLEAAGADRQDVTGNRRFAQLLGCALARSGRSVPMKRGQRGMLPATAKTDAEMQRLLNDKDPQVAALAAARIGKKGEAQQLARLGVMERIAKSTGGTLPVYLVYYGSHTGRFSGGGGFNAQNLGRRGVGLRIRALLRPAPGRVFVQADFAQIEARVTAWLAGERPMLEAFSRGDDLYSDFASRTFGRAVHKPRNDETPEERETLGRLRQVGKQAVLGLGFGMGGRKFMDTLRRDPETARLFDTGELTAARCIAIVQSFRGAYPRIPQLWRDLEAAARRAIDGWVGECCGLGFSRAETALLIRLPSGRSLRYPRARLDSSPRCISFLLDDGSESQSSVDGPSIVCNRDTCLYGGLLCENVAQAIARDLMVDAIWELERAQLPVVFHVHDEVVLEVDMARGEDAARSVHTIMTTPPPWAPVLPLGCEVRLSRCYG